MLNLYYIFLIYTNLAMCFYCNHMDGFRFFSVGVLLAFAIYPSHQWFLLVEGENMCVFTFTNKEMIVLTDEAIMMCKIPALRSVLQFFALMEEYATQLNSVVKCGGGNNTKR